jgi:radical SAM superfamily enzyme YgiQ (UPF0313 family)
LWKRRIRYRSLDNVFGEIEELVSKHACSFLYIYDDNFTANHSRLMDFCMRKQKYFPDLKWFCHTRADSISSEDIVGQMSAAGCVEVQVGVESGVEEVLRDCNKRERLGSILKAFKLLNTEETIKETIRFATKLDPTYASFMFLSPLPGTKFFEEFSRKGYIKTYDWSKYNWHTTPVFETEYLSKNLLLRLRKQAYLKFYIRPQVWVRYLRAFVASGQWKIAYSNFCLLIKFMLGLIVSKDFSKK